jgi:hypothetical protein
VLAVNIGFLSGLGDLGVGGLMPGVGGWVAGLVLRVARFGVARFGVVERRTYSSKDAGYFDLAHICRIVTLKSPQNRLQFIAQNAIPYIAMAFCAIR